MATHTLSTTITTTVPDHEFVVQTDTNCHFPYCPIDSASDCELAANLLNMSDQTVFEQSKSSRPEGCWFNDAGSLQFNTGDGSSSDVLQTLLCWKCDYSVTTASLSSLSSTLGPSMETDISTTEPFSTTSTPWRPDDLSGSTGTSTVAESHSSKMTSTEQTTSAPIDVSTTKVPSIVYLATQEETTKVQVSTPPDSIEISVPTVDCVGAWSSWGSCSATCGVGQFERTFSVTQAADSGGEACLNQDGDVASEDCFDNACDGEQVVTVDYILSDYIEKDFIETVVVALINNEDTLTLSDYDITVTDSVDIVSLVVTYTELSTYTTNDKEQAVRDYLANQAGTDELQLSFSTSPAVPNEGNSVTLTLQVEGALAFNLMQNNEDDVLDLLCASDNDESDVVACKLSSNGVTVEQSEVSVNAIAAGHVTDNEIVTLQDTLDGAEFIQMLASLDDDFADVTAIGSASIVTNTDEDTESATLIIIVVVIVVIILIVVVVVIVLQKKRKRGKVRHLHPEIDAMTIGTTKLRGNIVGNSDSSPLRSGSKRMRSHTASNHRETPIRSSSRAPRLGPRSASQLRSQLTENDSGTPAFSRAESGLRLGSQQKGEQSDFALTMPARSRSGRLGPSKRAVNADQRSTAGKADTPTHNVSQESGEERVQVSVRRQRRKMNKNAEHRLSYADQAKTRDMKHSSDFVADPDSNDTSNADVLKDVKKTRVGPTRRRPVSPVRRDRGDATAAVQTLSEEVEGVKNTIGKTRVGPSRRRPPPPSRLNKTEVSDNATERSRIGPSRRRRDGASSAGVVDASSSSKENLVARIKPDVDRSGVPVNETSNATDVTANMSHVGPRRGQRRQRKAVPTTVVEKRVAPDGIPYTKEEYRSFYGESWDTYWESATPVDSAPPAAATTQLDDQEPLVQREKATGSSITGKIGPSRARRNGRGKVDSVTSKDNGEKGSGSTVSQVSVGPRGRRKVHDSATDGDAVRLGPRRGRQRVKTTGVAATESANISVTNTTGSAVQSTRIGPSRGNRRRRAPPPPARK
jgi:hypothetical protein